MNFSISINGGTAVDIQSIGGRVMSRRQINQGVGSCRLEFKRRLGGELPPLVFGDVVRIWVNGRGYFYGTAQSPTFRNDAGQISYAVEVKDAWNRLEDLYFCRGGGPIDGSPTGDFDVGFVNANAVTVTSTLIGGYLSTRTLLGRSGLMADADFLTLDQQLTEVMTYAASRLSKNPGARFTLPSDWLGLTGPAFTLPEEIANLKCSDVVTKILRWFPDTAHWMDYSALTTSSHPGLRLVRMGEVTPTEYTYADNRLRVLNMTVRDDMRPAGVVLRFESAAVTDLWRVYNWWESLMQQYPAGTQANNPRVLAQSLPLPTDYLVPSVLAQQLYNTLSARVVEGTLTLTGKDLDLDLRPGLAVVINGDSPAWPAGGRLYVQEVTDDPQSGSQTLRCGYPGHLGITDLRTLGTSLALSLYLGRGTGSGGAIG
jgi:hypothetical protein